MSDSNMSVRNDTRATTDVTSRNPQTAAQEGTQAPDPSDLQQQGQLFRTLMETPLTARQLAELAARPANGRWLGQGTEQNPGVPERWPPADSRDGYQGLGEHSHPASVDVSAMIQAQQAIDQGPGLQPAAAAGAPDPSIAELIEKHVRRAMAAVEARGGGDGEVRIELSDAVFPGTALSLKRTSAGWQLIATADNRQSLDKLHHFTPALIERFARASLGHLEVSVDG